VAPTHHPEDEFELRAEAALRLLIEQKFRDAIEQRKPKILEQKSISSSTSGSSRTSGYEPPKFNLDHFVDATIGEISTPLPTPAPSRVATPPSTSPPPPVVIEAPPPVQTTIENIIDDESMISSEYHPLPQE